MGVWNYGNVAHGVVNDSLAKSATSPSAATATRPNDADFSFT